MIDQEQNLLDETRALWEERLGRELSDSDAMEILRNVTGFFKVLMEWDRKDESKAEEQQDAAHISTSNSEEQVP